MVFHMALPLGNWNTPRLMRLATTSLRWCLGVGGCAWQLVALEICIEISIHLPKYFIEIWMNKMYFDIFWCIFEAMNLRIFPDPTPSSAPSFPATDWCLENVFSHLSSILIVCRWLIQHWSAGNTTATATGPTLRWEPELEWFIGKDYCVYI